MPTSNYQRNSTSNLTYNPVHNLSGKNTSKQQYYTTPAAQNIQVEVLAVKDIKSSEQQSQKKKRRRWKATESRESSTMVQVRSRTDRPRLAAVSARFGHACRRLRRFILFVNFGHISDTDHILDTLCRGLDKVEQYDGLLSDIICPLPKLPGDRVQRLQVCSGSKSGEDASQTEPWIADHENQRPDCQARGSASRHRLQARRCAVPCVRGRSHPRARPSFRGMLPMQGMRFVQGEQKGYRKAL